MPLAEQLSAITGTEHVHPSETAVTVSPADTQQVSEILRYANENGITVTPTGGNTKQSWDGPSATDLRLDLTRLNRVLEHPWQDLTCTVEAGCTWQKLRQTLARHGQFVALDPLWPEQATVGGILATNDSGALRHRYGSLRDLVIGMTLVLADGTVARSGGKVVKNVAGYDLCKLITGSFGTLAVITEATFRLHPLPQHTQTFTVFAPQAGELAPLVASIRGSHLLTEALQLRGDAIGFHLDIQLNAHPEAKQAELLEEMTGAAGLKLTKSQNEIWRAREQLFADDGAYTLKLTMLPSAVTKVAEHLSRCEATSVFQSLGIAYAKLPAPDHNSVTTIEVLDDLLTSDGGSLTILKGPRSFQRDLRSIPSGPATFALMQTVKHQFDPKRTLNPGRLQGGMETSKT